MLEGLHLSNANVSSTLVGQRWFERNELANAGGSTWFRGFDSRPGRKLPGISHFRLSPVLDGPATNAGGTTYSVDPGSSPGRSALPSGDRALV
jgi:hypothetical protein